MRLSNGGEQSIFGTGNKAQMGPPSAKCTQGKAPYMNEPHDPLPTPHSHPMGLAGESWGEVLLPLDSWL